LDTTYWNCFIIWELQFTIVVVPVSVWYYSCRIRCFAQIIQYVCFAELRIFQPNFVLLRAWRAPPFRIWILHAGILPANGGAFKACQNFSYQYISKKIIYIKTSKKIISREPPSAFSVPQKVSRTGCHPMLRCHSPKSLESESTTWNLIWIYLYLYFFSSVPRATPAFVSWSDFRSRSRYNIRWSVFQNFALSFAWWS